jgi:hypothetical protein
MFGGEGMRKVERLSGLRLKNLPVGLHPDGANLFFQVTGKDAQLDLSRQAPRAKRRYGPWSTA